LDLLVYGTGRLLKSNSSYTVENLLAGKLNKMMKIPDTFRFPDLETPAGKIILDDNGDRKGDFAIMNFLPSEPAKSIGVISNGKFTPAQENGVDVTILYPGGSNVRPKDRLDPTDIALFVKQGSTLGILALVFMFLGLFISFGSLIGTIMFKMRPVIRQSSI
jgi:hypothetical protein